MSSTAVSLLAAFCFFSLFLLFLRWVISIPQHMVYDWDDEEEDKIAGYILPDAHGKVLVIKNDQRKTKSEEADAGSSCGTGEGISRVTQRNA